MDAKTPQAAKNRNPTADQRMVLAAMARGALGTVTRATPQVLAHREEILRRAAEIDAAQAAEVEAAMAAEACEPDGPEDEMVCPVVHGVRVMMLLPDPESAAAYLIACANIERGMRADASARRHNPEGFTRMPTVAEEQHPEIVARMMDIAERRDQAAVAGGARGGRPRHRRPRAHQVALPLAPDGTN